MFLFLDLSTKITLPVTIQVILKFNLQMPRTLSEYFNSLNMVSLPSHSNYIPESSQFFFVSLSDMCKAAA
jgi:hypothetical protein